MGKQSFWEPWVTIALYHWRLTGNQQNKGLSDFLRIKALVSGKVLTWPRSPEAPLVHPHSVLHHFIRWITKLEENSFNTCLKRTAAEQAFRHHQGMWVREPDLAWDVLTTQAVCLWHRLENGLMNCFLKSVLAALGLFPPLLGLATQAPFSCHMSLFPLVGHFKIKSGTGKSTWWYWGQSRWWNCVLSLSRAPLKQRQTMK